MGHASLPSEKVDMPPVQGLLQYRGGHYQPSPLRLLPKPWQS
jgi:hypothetical protein